jgi:LPXTG-motif cell wall-anchored protein
MNSNSSADQNASGAAANQNAGANSSAKGGNLPQTGSELPLLGLLGIGSLSAGVWRAYLKK